MVTFDLGRVTTSCKILSELIRSIVVTFDLGRVTTARATPLEGNTDCGDVRSRTSYNLSTVSIISSAIIVVTFDLGRVTTIAFNQATKFFNCGDVRSRTSYNAR